MLVILAFKLRFGIFEPSRSKIGEGPVVLVVEEARERRMYLHELC